MLELLKNVGVPLWLVTLNVAVPGLNTDVDPRDSRFPDVPVSSMVEAFALNIAFVVALISIFPEVIL